MRVFRIIQSIRTSLWFVPVVCVAVGLALSLGTLYLDRQSDYSLVPDAVTPHPEAALFILATIAQSMVSLAALVLTITMVVVQLAMGQFSPRIVQTFLQDKPSQIAIGLFVATFTHALVALREVDSEAGTVPGLAIIVAYVLVILSISVLVLYVHHIGQSLRVSSLLELVGDKTRRLLDDLYPDAGDPLPPSPQPTICARASGVITHVGHDRLIALARDANVRLELVPAVGEFVPAGAPLFRVHGDLSRLDVDGVLRSVVLGLERRLDQDVAYGIRMLVDIAERCLADSPFQDPTTAVQAIDRLHDCLRQLARRPFPGGEHRDGVGALRLTVPSMDWDAYVHLAFDEVRQAGARSPQVTRRLQAALDDLLTVALPERRAVLEEQMELLHAAARNAVVDDDDLPRAIEADALGLGPTAGALDSAPLSH